MAKNNRTVDRIQAIWHMIGGDDVADKLIAGKAKIVIEPILRLSGLTIVVVPKGAINPHEFFKDREGLLVSDDFQNLILAKASDKKVFTDETTIGFADLIQAANAIEIRDELPNSNVFKDIDTFLCYLSIFIKGQRGGKDGLLDTVQGNLFQVLVGNVVFTVYVFWSNASEAWDCSIAHHIRDDLSDTVWERGHRIFSFSAPPV